MRVAYRQMTTTSTRYATTIDAIRDAARRIAPYALRTPVVRCTAISERAGHPLRFKCENFQKVGAFKFRGASYSLACLTPDELAKGVCTHSSGEAHKRPALYSQ